MIRTAALAVLVLAAGTAAAQPRTLPPEVAKLYEQKPVIELVTMGVGSLIWERHGHIALCVHYDNPRDDRCYNYGIGDFHHPLGMAWGFFRGTGSFWVGEMHINQMLQIYTDADRTVWVQPLPLTAEEKQKVLAKLKFDIQEPNKYYAYDHFWDNCTTRVRDVLDNATGGKLSAMKEPTDGKTYRDLAREGFFGLEGSWAETRLPLLITDIAMGRKTDRVPTYYERMFLPQYLREAVTKLWGIEPIVVYERQGAPQQTDGPSNRPWLVMWIVILTSPAWLTRLWGRFQRTGLAIAMLPYLILGFVETFLAVISPLPYVRWNETVLVWLVLDVVVLFLPAPRNVRYAKARLIMLAAMAVLGFVGVFKQPELAPMLWPAIPLAVVAFWPPKVRAAAKPAAKPAKRN
jgi:hypothetical protein